MRTIDVAVIGGGTAGSAAARAVHDAGGEVVLFNDGELGGLCILRGCMPTKTLLHAAHAAHEARHSGIPGISTRLEGIDFAAVMENKRAKVSRFKRAKIAGIEAGGYELVDARARFIGDDRIEAAGDTYVFRRGAVIATGSVPYAPTIEGLAPEAIWSSDDALEAESAPKSLVVSGSGAIGLELAQFFSRMGTKVTLVARTPVFSRIDAGLAREIERVLIDEPNLELLQPRVILRAEAGTVAGTHRLTLDDGHVVDAERVLFATGRRPAHAGLDLAGAGIEHDHGRIVCGDDMRTSNPRVFVAGDATGDEQLLHVANLEGGAAGLNAYLPDRPPQTVCRRLALSVVFTDPPAAWLGETPDEVRARGVEPLVAQELMAETGRAITMETRHGMLQLVAEPNTGEILGTQVIGPRADDLVHVAAVAMAGRMTAAQLLEVPWYHPTLSEVFLSLVRDLARRTTAGAG